MKYQIKFKDGRIEDFISWQAAKKAFEDIMSCELIIKPEIVKDFDNDE